MPNELSTICGDRNSDPVGQRAAIETLIANGADLHAFDKNGVITHHHAVRFQSPTAMETLLEAGAVPNRRCKRSSGTPLHRAVTSTGAAGTAGRSKQAIEIVKLLLRYNADPAFENRLGEKPGDYVNDTELTKLLGITNSLEYHIKGGRNE